MSTHNANDFYQVSISKDGGEWEYLEGPFSGNSNNWNPHSVVVPDCAGTDLRFLFYFRGADDYGYTSAFGVAIDHIYFEGLGLLAHRTTPAANDFNVDESGTVRVDFSEPADAATINASTFEVTGSESGPVTGTFAHAPSGLAFTFTPDTPFAPDEFVTCRLTDGVHDADGDPLDGDGDMYPGGDYVWEFCTFDQPCPTAPPIPTDLAATVDDATVALAWQMESEVAIVEYRIYRGETPESLTQIGAAPAGTLTYDDDTGISGTQYIYAVTAYNVVGRESPYSDDVCATPGDTEAPVQPTGLDTSTGDRLITLTWDNNDECDLVAYWITRTPEEGSPAVIDTVSALAGSSMTYGDDTVDNYVEYCYEIQAVDNAGLASGLSATACDAAEGPVADLALVKTVDVTNIDVGQTVTFTLEVTNNGPDTAFNTLAVDTLPDGLTFVSALPSQGEFGTLTGEWAIGQLDNAGVATLTLSATVDVPTDTLTNTATVADESSSDTVPDNDTDSAWVVGHACDLAVTKSVDDTDPSVGDEIVFKVKVENNGPDAAVDVVVEDALPGGLYYTSVVKSAGTYIGDNWRLGTMPVGQVDSMMVRATVLVADLIANTATVSVAHPPDPDDTNDTAEATIRGHSADLSLRKTADPYSPGLGDTVTFSLTIENNGPSTAYNVVVVDEEPEGLTDVSYIWSAADSDFEDGTWTIAELGVGQELVLQIGADMATEDPVTNCAFIASSDQADPNPNNDMICATVSSDPVDVSVTKSVDETYPALGDTVTFEVIVENHTDSEYDATGLCILDRSAPGLTFVSATPSAGSYDMGTGIWSLDTLAYGEQDTLTIEAEVDLAAEIVNTATIVGADQADPIQVNNSAEVAIVGRAADLAVTKTLDNSYPGQGDPIIFVVTVKNNGPSTATDVHVQDLLPANVLTLTGYDQTGVTYDEIGGDWLVGDLLPGAANSKSLTIYADVLLAEPFTNTAEISGSSLPDPRVDNNLAWAGGHLTFADLALSKDVSDDAPPVNTNVTYTLTVVNNGPDDTSDIVIRDVLPSGVTWVSDTSSAGDYDDATSLWTIDSLLDGASATLNIVVTADVLDEITNQAEIVSLNGIDDNPNDNSAIEDMLPIDPPPAVAITGITPASVGESITVTASATDNGGIQDGTVTLHYCEGASGAYTDVVMSPTATPDTYAGTIPGASVTAAGVDCYVSARDMADNLGESAHGALTITVTLLSNPSSQPGGTEQSAYRMISIPLELDDPRPGPVFEDDFGTYDPAKWRLFGLNESQSWENSEFPNCGDVIPGRGFFLIVKQAGLYFDAGPGGTVPTAAPFAINLNEGWNLIGNPYNYAVPMIGVSLESGDPVDMRNFVGSWAALSGASSLEPFNGYLVAANSDDDRLLIDPVGAQNKVMPASDPPPLWAVGIEARTGAALDNDNTAAVYEKADTDWDRLDRPEPPVIGDYVTVSFPHPEWETPFPAYCRDARPVDAESGGQSWDLEVRTNVEGRVELTFSGVESVPADHQVWLRDELLLINVDLREMDTYTFVGASSGSPHALKLVVGDADYIAEALPAEEAIPRQVTLFANFPNPFNPLTTIRYGLPRDGRVKLGIYDLRGRLVATLVDEDRPAGYHAAVWEGDDHAGRRVSSGVYLYRLVTGDAMKTQKMLLMK